MEEGWVGDIVVGRWGYSGGQVVAFFSCFPKQSFIAPTLVPAFYRREYPWGSCWGSLVLKKLRLFDQIAKNFQQQALSHACSPTDGRYLHPPTQVCMVTM